MRPNLGDWRRAEFPSLNDHPSLTERTSSGPVRLRECPCFQSVSGVAGWYIRRSISRLAFASREREVGVFRRTDAHRTAWIQPLAGAFIRLVRRNEPSLSNLADLSHLGTTATAMRPILGTWRPHYGIAPAVSDQPIVPPVLLR